MSGENLQCWLLLLAVTLVILAMALFGNAIRRRMDMRILWPICKQNAPTLADAQKAFVVHMAMDSCWDPIVSHLSEDEFNAWCEEHLK